MRLRSQRSLGSVPKSIVVLLMGALAAQIAWHGFQPRPVARAEDLSPPPSERVLRVASLGDPIFLSTVLVLRLQAFDNQPGISIPFLQLDYHKIAAWLTVCLELDPGSQYPLVLATTVYGQVPDPAKQRLMLDFAYRNFFANPDRRWPWLAHAAVMAKHRLNDLPLALRYAEAVAERATGKSVPTWARQMRIFLLEDMGERETARILLGGLLASGTITDPREVAFLMQRLEELGQGEKSSVSPKN